MPADHQEFPQTEFPPRSLRLEGHQRALHQAIVRLHPEYGKQLAAMYVGSILVLGDESNPDSLAMAAHGIRELMEKLPRFLEVPMKAHGEKLGPRFGALKAKWEAAVRGAQTFDPDTCSGTIDSPLMEFLLQWKDLVDWHTNHLPRKRNEAARVLRQLDPSQSELPAPLVSEHLDLWSELDQYFIETAHHKPTVRATFLARFESFETFLLERIAPRTFQTFDAIDAILAEGENNDH